MKAFCLVAVPDKARRNPLALSFRSKSTFVFGLSSKNPLFNQSLKNIRSHKMT